MNKKIIAAVLLISFFATSCKDSNVPPVVSTDTDAPKTSVTTSGESLDEAVSTTTESEEQTVCQKLTEVIVHAVDFFATMEVVDKTTLEDIFAFDYSKFEEFSIVQNAISVYLYQAIVIKPSANQTEAVLQMMETHKASLIKNFAFYPSQVDSANATVIGEYKGYVYLICHEKADEAEKALLKAFDDIVLE